MIITVDKTLEETIAVKKRKMADDADGTSDEMTEKGQVQSVKWDEVKKVRNRINSQRTRERERSQIDVMEAERARLWVSNDAIRYQNKHFREAIQLITEVQEKKRAQSSGLGQGPSVAPDGPAPRQTMSIGGEMILNSSLPMQGSIGSSAFFSLPQALQLRHASRISQAQELAYAVAEREEDLLALRRHAATMEMQQQNRVTIGALGGMLPPSTSQRMFNHPSMLINQPRTVGSASPLTAQRNPFDMAEIRSRRLMLQGTDLETSIYRGTMSADAMSAVYPSLSARFDPRMRYLQEDAKQRELMDSPKRQKKGG